MLGIAGILLELSPSHLVRQGPQIVSRQPPQDALALDRAMRHLGDLVWAADGEAGVKSTSNRPSRKVIVGTAMQAFWVQYPGLEKRLKQLTDIVDQMAAQAKEKYDRGLDLAILPETAITGEAGGDAIGWDR